MNERDAALQVTIPSITKKSLKFKSAETGDPIRLLVLKALAATGYDVPKGELMDRRKAVKS